MLNSQSTTTQSICDNFSTFLSLADVLHRGARWRLFWTPNAGDTGDRPRSLYIPASAPFRPPADWLQSKNLYFSVNGLSCARKPHQSSHNEDVSAVNALYAEFDGVDEVQEHEWLPLYVQPALDGLTDGQARGALQKAQTQAREAAYALQPEEYKARALARIKALDKQPSACVLSGGGYQCYWLLEETVHVTEDNRAHVAHVQRAWVDFVGADHGAHDLRRILRPPGSRNHKKRYATPLEVRFLWCNLEQRYTFDELAALLPLEEPAPSPVHVRAPRALYTPPGLERLAMPAHVPPVPLCAEVDKFNASTPLPALLAQYGYTHAGPGRMHRPGGSTAGVELHEDNSATIYSSADPLYLGRRIRPADVLLVFEHAGDVDALLEALGATDMASVPTAVDALRLWARRVDFAALVPEELLEHGYRTRGRDVCAFLAVLDIMASQERQSLCAPLSLRKLGELANMGRSTAQRALQALSHAILEPTEGAEHAGQAQRYRVRPAIVAEALAMRRAQSCASGTGSAVEAKPVTTCPTYATLPADTHKAHDAYAYSLTPLTEEAWQARLQAAHEADLPPPVFTAQTRRRLAASLASLGRNALLVVDALEEAGGEADKADLRRACHMGAPTLARALRKLEGAGLVRLEHYSVELHGAWRDVLEEAVQRMPTHGTGARRAYKEACASAIYYAEAQEHAPPERQAYMRRRQAEAEARRDAYEELHGLQEQARERRRSGGRLEHGTVKAGTAAQWGALIEAARTRKDEARQEARAWRRPEKRQEKEQIEAARERAQEAWPLFWPWYQARYGAEFTTHKADEVLKHFLQWERTLTAPGAGVPTFHFDGAAQAAD